MEKKERIKREKLEKSNQPETTAEKTRKPRHKKLLREELEKQQQQEKQQPKNSIKKQKSEKNDANVNNTSTKKKESLKQIEMDIDHDNEDDDNNKNKKRKRSQKQNNDDNDNQNKKEKSKESKPGNKKKHDKFFDKDSAVVNESLDKDHHMDVDSSIVENTETISEEIKTKSNLSKQKPDQQQQLKKPERTGVLSIVDKSKHIKKKAKTEDVVQTLENLKQKEDSVATGLGADSWD